MRIEILWNLWKSLKSPKRLQGVGKLPWGGTGIYIQSYTFYEDMPCKPDSAAAEKALKGRAKLGSRAAIKGFKGGAEFIYMYTC